MPKPVIFTIDDDMEPGSWLDYGMFLQSIMVAARAFGLETCPQAAFAPRHVIVKKRLGIPDNEVVICGMALGHEDTGAPENKLVTERAAVAGFATFDGF